MLASTRGWFMSAVMSLRTNHATIAIVVGTLTLTAATPMTPTEIGPAAHALFAQPLAAFEDTCEQVDGLLVRHVRFATLDDGGRSEERLEIRVTMANFGLQLDYLTNDSIAFTLAADGEPHVTPRGQQLLMEAARGTKILAAFAAAHARIFAADVDAPEHACGTLRGKAEEQLKCGGIALFGCASGNPVVCFIAGGASLLCVYAVEKACEQEPETCQPGWTEG